MARVIRFRTAKFDVSQERPNPYNPIPGESLLLWLRVQARPDVELSEPAAEDWGWYATVTWHGRTYMLGASAAEDDNGEREWVLQIDKHRSFLEKILGRAQMTSDDACAFYFHRLLEQEPAFMNVCTDPEA